MLFELSMRQTRNVVVLELRILAWVISLLLQSEETTLYAFFTLRV